MAIKVGEQKFKCPRCKRIWWASYQTESVQCICHMDCEYCGKTQTVTTVVSRSAMNPKYEYDPQTHDPHPWTTAYGPCSNCGHYQSLPPVDALPTDPGEFDET